MKRVSVILVFVLVSAVLLFSCNNNPSKKNKDDTPVVVDDTSRSTKTVFVNPGTELGDFGTELVSRFSKKAEQFGSETDVTVVQASGFSKAEEINLVLASLINDGYVVVLRPSYGDWVSFVEKLEVNLLDSIWDIDYVVDDLYSNNLLEVYDFLCMLEENHKNLYYHTVEAIDEEDLLYEAIVMRTDEILFVESSDEANGISEAEIKVTRDIYTIDESVDDSEEVLESSEELDPEDNGLFLEIGNVEVSQNVDLKDSVNGIIDWISEESEGERELLVEDGAKSLSLARGPAEEAFKKISAQIVEYSMSNPVSTVWQGLEPVSGYAKINIRYAIWSMYSVNENADYYYIQQDVMALNDCLKCGPDAKDEWYERKIGSETIYQYGNWMRYVKSENRIDPAVASKVTLCEYTPDNKNGSQNVSTGMNFSLGGSIGINKSGISGGLSTGVSFSNSTSKAYPDILVTYRTDDQKNPSWDYQTKDVAFDWHVFTSNKHDIAPALAIHTNTMNHKWLWKIDAPEDGQTFSFTTTITLETQNCQMKKFMPGKYSKYTMECAGTKTFTINMVPPSRNKDNYSLSVTTPEGMSSAEIAAFNNLLKTKFGTAWFDNADIWHVKANDDEPAKKSFEAVMSRIENSKRLVTDGGFSGEFVFRIIKTSTGVEVATKTITF